MASSINNVVKGIIDLCEDPIACMRQVVWKRVCSSSVAGEMDTWGGNVPVIEICFDNAKRSCLFVGATDKSLVLRLSHSGDYEACRDIVSQIGDSDYAGDELVGTFDLDSVVSPVPGWTSLYITSVSVVTAVAAETVIGICFNVNLGIRIGLFVAPHPGITLSFNDTCDFILSQAIKAQQDGLVEIASRKFLGKETPANVHTIDWFDWLR